MSDNTAMTLGGHDRAYVLQLLAQKRDKRWRIGVLQCAVSLGVFTQAEWQALMEQIAEPEPRIPRVSTAPKTD